MPKTTKGIQWTRGEWANFGFLSNRSTPNQPMVWADAALLTKVNPNTPIDPEGCVGYWEVKNWPNEWQCWRVVVYQPQGDSTRYSVVLNPLLHLKYPALDSDVVTEAIIRQLFRVGKREYWVYRESPPQYVKDSWQVYSKTRQR